MKTLSLLVPVVFLGFTAFEFYQAGAGLPPGLLWFFAPDALVMLAARLIKSSPPPVYKNPYQLRYDAIERGDEKSREKYRVFGPLPRTGPAQEAIAQFDIGKGTVLIADEKALHIPTDALRGKNDRHYRDTLQKNGPHYIVPWTDVKAVYVKPEVHEGPAATFDFYLKDSPPMFEGVETFQYLQKMPKGFVTQWLFNRFEKELALRAFEPDAELLLKEPLKVRRSEYAGGQWAFLDYCRSVDSVPVTIEDNIRD